LFCYKFDNYIKFVRKRFRKKADQKLPFQNRILFCFENFLATIKKDHLRI
jgi:hypothetical protein